MWEAAKALPLSAGERELLEGFARAGSTPQKIALRVRIILRSADGVANHRLAAELGTSRPTVLRWRKRFEQAGLEGLLEDAPRPGRKRRLTPEKEEAIVNATLYRKPPGATHWSVRTLAQAQRVSPATVHRVWKAHRLQPHRVKRFSHLLQRNDPCISTQPPSGLHTRFWQDEAKLAWCGHTHPRKIQNRDRPQEEFGWPLVCSR